MKRGVTVADTLGGSAKGVISIDARGNDLNTTELVTKPCFRKPEDVMAHLLQAESTREGAETVVEDEGGESLEESPPLG